MPGTGRNILQFLALTIWILMAAYVIRIGIDWVTMKWTNNLTLAMYAIVGPPLAGGSLSQAA